MGKFKTWATFDWVLLIIIAFTFIFSVYISPQLPDLVPTHWNIAGQIDGWGPKWINLFLIPLISFAVLVLMSFAPLLDPLKHNYQGFSRQYTAFKTLLVGFFTLLYFVIIYASLNPTVNFMKFIFPVIFGFFFMAIGALLPSLKPNWFIGIRTPWTISDESVWTKTHALAGKLFIGSGGLIILTALLLPTASFYVFMAAIIGAGLGSVVYSYLLWHRRH